MCDFRCIFVEDFWEFEFVPRRVAQIQIPKFLQKNRILPVFLKSKIMGQEIIVSTEFLEKAKMSASELTLEVAVYLYDKKS